MLGIAEGKELGALEVLIGLVRDGTLSLEMAAHKAGMRLAAFKAVMEKGVSKSV